MKQIINMLILSILVFFAASLPYKDQLALVNSLQVGRDQDPNVWSCAGCTLQNKPLRSHIIEEPIHDIKAILSIYDEYTVLAFRYTATLKNVWQDILWAIQVSDDHACPKCKVQKKYDTMWNSIRQYTYADLEKTEKTKRLIITGISLGGGLACISFIDIRQRGYFESIEVVTFGAPRVGNRQWAQQFNQKTQSNRYFLSNDPIAALPRCLTPICNYKQTINAISCNKRKQICTKNCKKGLDEDLPALDVEMANEFMNGILAASQEDDINGILDHIYGYKKIYDYTLIDCPQ